MPAPVDPVGGPPAAVLRPATSRPVDGARQMLDGRIGDGRERILDVLRAVGMRFRDGARWRPAQ
ncbi:hypothetical protein E1091_07235 [Micromonospora fluostatini]|uniref:Uncharacterized protein n=1 Tax=Micromonospora fluostatini TaxID=1629071 RepID=A0ABY2DLI1_9ACTN|nr:hypothetical protein E1091_07235 [Micromonospora fluostatini]